MPGEWESVKLLQADRGLLPGSWSWDHKSSEGWQGFVFWLILGGRGQLDENGTTYDLAPGDCYIMQLNDEHHGRHDPSYPLHVPWMTFDLMAADGRALTHRPAGMPHHWHFERLDFLRELTVRVCTSYISDPVGANHWMAVLLHEVCAQATMRSGGRRISEETAEKLDRWCSMVRNYPERHYSIQDSARIAGLSPDHFIRVFKSAFGMTPRQYIIRIRIETGKSLLRFSNRPIGEIAEHLGYTDAYYFSRQFRAVMGISPSEFRSP